MIDGVIALDSTTQKEIQLTVPYTSLAKMYSAVGAQTAGSNAEAVYVDCIGGEEIRLGMPY